MVRSEVEGGEVVEEGEGDGDRREVVVVELRGESVSASMPGTSGGLTSSTWSASNPAIASSKTPISLFAAFRVTRSVCSYQAVVSAAASSSALDMVRLTVVMREVGGALAEGW